MVKTARNLVGHQIGWWLWWQLWWRIWWFTNFVDKFDDLFWSQNLSPNLSLNSSQYSSPNISPNFANQQIFHQIFHQNHHPISWPTKCGDENDIKIITQFGESPNKVTNMSPNSSPNLVITKFVTKFITKFVTKDLGDLYVLKRNLAPRFGVSLGSTHPSARAQSCKIIRKGSTNHITFPLHCKPRYFWEETRKEENDYKSF